MNGKWDYKKPCRVLSSGESLAIKQFCLKWWEEGYILENGKPSPPYTTTIFEYKYLDNKSKEMYWEHLRESTTETLTFMNKKGFDKEMKMIYKNIGKYFLPYLWITVSPRKQEGSFQKQSALKIARNLNDVLHLYFNRDFKRCDEIHWAIEFGSEGDHAHVHILCRPIEAQQKSMAKNFSRDFYNIWKKKQLSHLDKLDNKKICFNIKTLRREEFIRDKLKYLKNNTKDAVHDNPFDEEIFQSLDFKKYENC